MSESSRCRDSVIGFDGTRREHAAGARVTPLRELVEPADCGSSTLVPRGSESGREPGGSREQLGYGAQRGDVCRRGDHVTRRKGEARSSQGVADAFGGARRAARRDR